MDDVYLLEDGIPLVSSTKIHYNDSLDLELLQKINGQPHFYFCFFFKFK